MIKAELLEAQFPVGPWIDPLAERLKTMQPLQSDVVCHALVGPKYMYLQGLDRGNEPHNGTNRLSTPGYYVQYK
jgi:hypothetical protein